MFTLKDEVEVSNLYVQRDDNVRLRIFKVLGQRYLHWLHHQRWINGHSLNHSRHETREHFMNKGMSMQKVKLMSLKERAK